MSRLASGQGCVVVEVMLADGMDFVFAALKMGMYSGPFSPQNMVDFPKLGVPFWGPNIKDYSILGSILVSLYFGRLPYGFV